MITFDKNLAELNVIIGAGNQSYDGWVATHQEQLNLKNENDWLDSFKIRKADKFLCEHVWEHLTLEEGEQAAKYVYNALKAGGFARIAVPDANFPDQSYQQLVQVGGPGPSDHPASDHKIVYDFKTLTEVFESAGFKIDILEYCDTHGRFHYHQWDLSTGPIYRSLMSDHRNKVGEIKFTSLIIDAWK